MKTKFIYVGIRVVDLQSSIDFYTKLLGMKVVERFTIEQTKGEGVNLESEDGCLKLELNYYEKNSPHNTKYIVGEGLDHLAFKVDDLDKALEEARIAGYPCFLKINAGNNQWAYIEDPNGIWIELNA